MSQELEQEATDTVGEGAKVRPEAELESRIFAALLEAFPNIQRDDLKAQLSFTVRLGHDTYDVDAVSDWKKRGRADLILNLRGRPLAVVEVKREDQPLTPGVFKQAQSYANLLNPRPPLVVVSNGLETLVYDSDSGGQWTGGDDAAGAIQRLFANAGKMAAADKRWAIEALMGREADLWVSMVRKSSERLIGGMTDKPGKGGRPFTRDVLFPRKASGLALQALLDPDVPLFTVVEGAPLAGKSSVLREIVLATQASEELAVLMLRGNRTGLFQSLANLFSAELEWNLSPTDVRQWLRRMSVAEAGPILVLAVDGVDPESDMAADLEELPTLLPGSHLKVILTTDQSNALIQTGNGRGKTALGESAWSVHVDQLDLDELRQALQVLADHGVLFAVGVEYAVEYRAPWLLRFLYDEVAREGIPGHSCVHPPALGLGLIGLARKVHAGQHELERGYRLLARCMLADEEVIQSNLVLATSNGFLVRQDALTNEARAAVETLQGLGAARRYRHPTGEDVVVPTMPAAFLAELGRAAGEELITRIKVDPEEAGEWLGWRLDSVDLGDLAGAEALRTVVDLTGSLSLGVIEGLLSIVPVESHTQPEALLGFEMSDGTLAYATVRDGHLWQVDRQGLQLKDLGEVDSGFGKNYARLTAWMILGQFSRLATAKSGDAEQRVDAEILLQIGKNPFPLCRPNKFGLPYYAHDIAGESMLCGQIGGIEPTTLAIADLLSRPWDGADDWIEAVLQSDSQSLLRRVEAALNTVQSRQIPVRSDWAAKTRRDLVKPALEAMLLEVAHNGSTTSPAAE